jgi:hypothetical protein
MPSSQCHSLSTRRHEARPAALDRRRQWLSEPSAANPCLFRSASNFQSNSTWVDPSGAGAISVTAISSRWPIGTPHAVPWPEAARARLHCADALSPAGVNTMAGQDAFSCTVSQSKNDLSSPEPAEAETNVGQARFHGSHSTGCRSIEVLRDRRATLLAATWCAMPTREERAHIS